MRILHVDRGHEMRGGQWQVLGLHTGLVATGNESLLLAPAHSLLLAEARRRDLPASELRPTRLTQQSRRFDLLHAHDAHGHTLCALFARVPFVVSRRVCFPVQQNLLSRWKYRRPALFLAVSRFVAEQLMMGGIRSEKIVVVYDGVPVPTNPASGDAVLIPFTLDPSKGMALAEQSAQLAGVPVRMTVDLIKDLPDARALVYLSRSEGLGSGILLAMAHGTTVIATDTGGIPEMIEDGVNGILVPNEPAAIAAAFSRIRQELGTAARLTVLQRFTEKHLLHHTLDAYRMVLSSA